jgi:mono/diheme cytochrome c family protein
LCGIVLVFAALMFASGAWWVAFDSPRHRIYHPPDDTIAVPTDAASRARGKHLVEAVAVCTICHSDDLGGKLAFDDGFLGRAYTPNLTAGHGGVGAWYSSADWVRSLRYGVRPDGHGILFMPSDHYNRISDADLSAIIAYLRQVPPVDNARTGVELNVLARLLIDAGLFGEVVRAARIDMGAGRTAPLDNAGAYLVAVGGCAFCHGPGLTGAKGPEPGAPAAPNLTQSGPHPLRSFAAFTASLRVGRGADGRAINPKYMPWPGYRGMTNDEISAIWTFCGHGSDTSSAGSEN